MRALERARLANLLRRDARKLTAVEGVRRQRQIKEKRSEKYFLVRLLLRSWQEMEQQVAALMQQVMDMTERLRQSEVAAQQAW